MINIPSRETKTITQLNRGNLFGNLWASFNIDLQYSLGRFAVGRRMKVNTSTTDDADLGLPVAFEQFDQRVWALCGTRIFKNTGNNLTSAFSEDSSTGAVTTYSVGVSDMRTFNGALVATTGTNIYSKASDGAGTGAWTSRSGALSSLFPHVTTYFQKLDRLYITNVNTVVSLDTSWSLATSGSYFIDLGTTLTALGTTSTLCATSDYVYIGTNRRYGAAVYQWDGVSNQINKEYKINATAVMASCVKDDVPYIVDSNGIIRQFTGYGFKEVARFPLKGKYLYASANTGNDDRFIHPNGMTVTEDGTILMLVNNRNLYLGGTTENSEENMNAGVWEWSEKNGLVHKHSMSYMPLSSTSVTDYGQMRLHTAGAIKSLNLANTSSSGSSRIICGATQYTNATSTTNAIFVDAPIPTDNAVLPEGQKYGSFVTTWIESQNIKDSWIEVVAKYKQLLSSTDRIWLKYRTREAVPLEATITWTSTSTFTTTANVLGKEGYEVEVIQGTGSGKTAHITVIDVAAGTYTVTLDEEFTGATGTAIARVQNWKKLNSTVADQTSESKIFNIGASSERIQIKCCMQFTGDNELHEIAIINAPHEQYDR